MINFHLSKYVEAASKLNINFKIINESSLVKFSNNHKVWSIYKAVTPLNPSSNASLSTDKDLAKLLLSKSGIKVPFSTRFTNPEESKIYFQDLINKKVVVKPNKGISGNGITLLPNNLEEFEQAFTHAKQFDNNVLVEEFIPGNNYRLLVLNDEVIAAATRLPASVTGDGKSTVEELIELKNKDTLISNLKPIIIDSELIETLNSIHLKLSSVLKVDEEINVRRNSNLSTGGTVEDITNDVDPRYKEISIKACMTLGLKLAGVDIITNDITKYSENYAINELNHNPGLRIHYLPTKGEPRDVALIIQKYILENL